MKNVLLTIKYVIVEIIKISVWILAASILCCTCMEHGWIYTEKYEVTHAMFRQVFGCFIGIMPVVITIKSLCGRYRVETEETTEIKVETFPVEPESYVFWRPIDLTNPVSNKSYHINNNEWQDLKNAFINGAFDKKIGDVVYHSLNNGTFQQWTITDIGKDYIRFDSEISIGNMHMNFTSETAGGIAASNMQNYLDHDIWRLLPDDLKSVIAETDRKYLDENGQVKTYTTKLFLPDASEVFSDICAEERLYQQLDVYKSRVMRQKHNSNCSIAQSWWLATPCDQKAFYSVWDEKLSNDDANMGLGVIPCFLIKKD